MGAFDGYTRILSGCTLPATTARESYPYFKNQPAFNFHKNFGMPELKSLLAAAELDNNDTVWVPHDRGPGWGHIGLSTWYVRALIKEHTGDIDERTN